MAVERGELREYEVVRVVRLEVPERPLHPGSRQPRVGDSATIVMASGGPGGPVLLECVDERGQTLWLADFARDELEFVERCD